MGDSSFRDLKVWQRAIELSVAIYRMTGAFPREEMYGLTAQLRRADVSIASNIAEGYGRMSAKEYTYFLGIARGSTLEVQTHLVIAKELGFADEANLQRTEGLAHEVGKMLWAMLNKL
ncbi:four helix bundle protein [Paracidobacterium acidisoli]|uniref:Four helix bundle protein n=1 Tax=Paracidobacterium acidisoli TaxID=2303751 RepID=A0A372IIY0_9BACT|nr:four helix bundle protein [Paracidobacterium acidisoli]MBT9333311.1 four helix bundle protein [Paracidobacterium acidisoli]